MLKINFANISLLLVGIFYAWFVLPAVNARFDGGFYNLLFFSCYVLGMAGLLLARRGQLRINKMIIIVAIYCVAILIMTFFRIADAAKHVRIGLVFFTTILLYFLVLNTTERVKFGKYLLFLFLITCVTSSIGVLTDNRVGRIISHAAADDDLQKALGLMNIAGNFLFQCMVLSLPTFYAAMENQKILRFGVVVGVGMILLNASFTISLVLYVTAIVLILYQRYSKNLSKRVLITVLLLILSMICLWSGYEILTGLSELIDNEYISVRILNIRNMLYGQRITGGTLKQRLALYEISWKTFTKNLLGVGPYYAYKGTAEGIGYHSQILDDLARYGIFAIAWYLGFFTEYYRWLKREWNKVDCAWVASVTVILYFGFLLFNIGMRTGIESIVVTFIIPTVPEILLSKNRKIQM